MNILINNELLDFTLEKEQNIGDVIKNVENCLMENGNVIESISVDDRVVSFDYTSAEFRRSLSEVKVLQILTSNQVELAFRTVVTVGEYINKILDEYLNADFLKYYDDIIEGLSLIYEGIIGSIQILKIKCAVVINTEGKTLADMMANLKELIEKYEKQYLDEDGIELLRAILQNLLQIIPKIFKWAVIKNYTLFNSIEKDRMASYMKTINSDIYTVSLLSMEKFEEIGNNLQLGEDLRALNDLFYVTDLIEEIISIFVILKNLIGDYLTSMSDPFDCLCDRLFHGLSLHLKEVEKAFRDGDMITVGDILEYEIKPLFKNITEQIEKINDLL